MQFGKERKHLVQVAVLVVKQVQALSMTSLNEKLHVSEHSFLGK